MARRHFPFALAGLLAWPLAMALPAAPALALDALPVPEVSPTPLSQPLPQGVPIAVPTPSTTVPNPSSIGSAGIPAVPPAAAAAGTGASAPPLVEARPDGSLYISSQPAAGPGPATASIPLLQTSGPIDLVATPVGQALAVGIWLFPLTLLLWGWVLLRTLRAARSWRTGSMRLTLAADLGLRPMELASMPTESLLRLRDQLAFDELTGVMRRSAGVASLEREIALSRRRHNPLSVAFVDVDGLKAANDGSGHAAGDALLKTTASVLQARLRAADLVFRYGGDEFVCLLPDTEAAEADRVMADLRMAAERRGVTFSYGLAEWRRGDDSVSLLGRADTGMYDDKEARRRRPAPKTRTRTRRPRAGAAMTASYSAGLKTT